jgi:hypothetical protein
MRDAGRVLVDADDGGRWDADDVGRDAGRMAALFVHVIHNHKNLFTSNNVMALRNLALRFSPLLSSRLSRPYVSTHTWPHRFSPKFPPSSFPAAKASTSVSSSTEPETSDIPNAESSEAPPPILDPAVSANDGVTDWSKSYSGLSQQAFTKDIADVLLAPLDAMDIEMKPGGPSTRFHFYLSNCYPQMA